jgi:hypothetical protein
MARCQRCYKETNVTTMSFFDTKMICMECSEKERSHPEYQKAKDAELSAVKSGNYNYQGIGYPGKKKEKTR